MATASPNRSSQVPETARRWISLALLEAELELLDLSNEASRVGFEHGGDRDVPLGRLKSAANGLQRGLASKRERVARLQSRARQRMG